MIHSAVFFPYLFNSSTKKNVNFYESKRGSMLLFSFKLLALGNDLFSVLKARPLIKGLSKRCVCTYTTCRKLCASYDFPHYWRFRNSSFIVSTTFVSYLVLVAFYFDVSLLPYPFCRFLRALIAACPRTERKGAEDALWKVLKHIYGNEAVPFKI